MHFFILFLFFLCVSQSERTRRSRRQKRQQFYGQRYVPQGNNYNFDYPSQARPSFGQYESRYESGGDPFDEYNSVSSPQPNRRVNPNNSPYANYDYYNNAPTTSVHRDGFYQQNGQFSFRVRPNQFRNSRVPLAKPGHLARQGGRKVRPPGVLDDRVLHPRNKNLNGDRSVIEPTFDSIRDSSDSSSEYETQIDYTYDQDYTQISEDSYDDHDFSGDSEVVDQLDNINLNQSQLISEGPTEPRPSHPADPDNRGLPDIQTDPLRLEQTLNVDYQYLGNLSCAMEEGCLSPSAYNIDKGQLGQGHLRKLLRFTQKITNIGDADFLSPHHPDEWQYHTCHKHYHSMNVFATFELIQVTGAEKQTVASSHKASFCLEDSECLPGRKPKYDCKHEQAISPGCSDIYVSGIDCQWIDVTDVQVGHYILKVEVNPSHLVEERSYENNILSCDVYLSRQRAWAKNCRNTVWA